MTTSGYVVSDTTHGCFGNFTLLERQGGIPLSAVLLRDHDNNDYQV
jgi:hypothetical protein